MKNNESITIKNNGKLVLIFGIHTISFIIEIIAAILFFNNYVTIGITIFFVTAILELFYGIYVMVQSAKHECNDSYLTTSGAMYMCPFSQPIGIYFQIRFFMDKVTQAKRKRTRELKKKEVKNGIR